MSRILYISAFVPCENGRHAGARAAYENLRRLRASAAVDVVVCTTESVADAPASGDMKIIRHRFFDFLAYVVRYGAGLGIRAIVAAPFVHTRLNARAQALIVEMLSSASYDAVFADFTQIVRLVRNSMVVADRSGIPISACLHDVFAQRALRTPSLPMMLATGAVVREEQDMVRAASKVMVLSSKDRDLVSCMYAAEHVQVVPFIPPAWSATVSRRAGEIDVNSVLFFGNFERPENQLAVEWFLLHAMSDVERALPEFKLILVGAGSDRFARRVGHSRVSGTGFVPDPSIYFSRCILAIAPLMHGAGVKFKVLEALACGIPVVGTPVACEGIDDSPLLFRAESIDFAGRVLEVLRELRGDVRN